MLLLILTAPLWLPIALALAACVVIWLGYAWAFAMMLLAHIVIGSK